MDGVEKTPSVKTTNYSQQLREMKENVRYSDLDSVSIFRLIIVVYYE